MVSVNLLVVLVKLGVVMVIIYGVVSILIMVMIVRVRVSSLEMYEINMWVVFLFCLFLYLVRIGINVCEKVFLVKICCSRLGSLKVIKKVLVVILVLKICVIIVLWVKFSMCENMVIELIVVSDFKRFIMLLF